MLAIQLMPERDCAKCTAHQMREWGCEQNAPLPMVMDGEDLWRCPRRPIKDDPVYVSTVISAYRAYMRGYLPDDGSLEDQGYRYTVLMGVVENAISEAQAETDRRERRKAKTPGG